MTWQEKLTVRCRPLKDFNIFIERQIALLKKIFHHSSLAGGDCSKFCCTKIEGFTVKHGSHVVFENVNLHIHCGQITSLIGPNGAGKSTFLKAILGEVKHQGSLKYVDAKGAHSGHPVIGYVPQSMQFDTGSPTSVMDLFMACLTSRPVWLCPAGQLRKQILEKLKRTRAEHLIDRRLGALSGGELQRVLLALALDPLPDILLLDEPVSGVDQNGQQIFRELLEELREDEDMAIIMVSHDLNFVAECSDQVVLLDGGVVAAGTPDEVFDNPKTRKSFGMLLGREEE